MRMFMNNEGGYAGRFGLRISRKRELEKKNWSNARRC